MKGGESMKIEQEIEALKKRVKLLEEFRELQKKVEELEKQIAKPIIPSVPYYPVYPCQPIPNPYPWWGYEWSTGNRIFTVDGNTSTLTENQGQRGE